GLSQCLFSRSSCSDELIVGFAQQHFDGGANYRMVVGEKDSVHAALAIGNVIDTFVTCIPRESSSAPPACSTRSRIESGISRCPPLCGYAVPSLIKSSRRRPGAASSAISTDFAPA